jgi:hypothetical protein
MSRSAFLLSALLAAGPVPAQDLHVTERPVQPDDVPPGARDDQLLYRSLHEVTVELRKQANVSRELFFESHYATLNLDYLAKGAKPDERARLDELRARLDPLVNAASAAMPTTGVHGCRYTLMHLEDSMVAAAAGEGPASGAAKRLPEKRAEARKCDRDARDALARMVPALKALRAGLDEYGPEIRERRAARDAAAPAGTAAQGEPARPAAAPDRKTAAGAVPEARPAPAPAAK